MNKEQLLRINNRDKKNNNRKKLENTILDILSFDEVLSLKEIQAILNLNKINMGDNKIMGVLKRLEGFNLLSFEKKAGAKTFYFKKVKKD